MSNGGNSREGARKREIESDRRSIDLPAEWKIDAFPQATSDAMKVQNGLRDFLLIHVPFRCLLELRVGSAHLACLWM